MLGTRTVTYNGAGQTVAGWTYNNLRLSGSRPGDERRGDSQRDVDRWGDGEFAERCSHLWVQRGPDL